MNPQPPLPPLVLDEIFAGWEKYQSHLVQALEPLTVQQLELRAAPTLRSAGMIAAHIIGARARWFNFEMKEGGEEMKQYTDWDHGDPPIRSGSEYARGLTETWRLMSEARARWTPEDWAYVFRGEDEYGPYSDFAAWIIWHLIEHDLHHGGELSFLLGMHNIASPEL